MGVDNKGTPTYLRCRRLGNDTSIRILCDYIHTLNYSVFLVARQDSRWTNNDGRTDVLFSNNAGNWDMHCRLGTGTEQGGIYVAVARPLGEVHTNIPDATKL